LIVLERPSDAFFKVSAEKGWKWGRSAVKIEDWCATGGDQSHQSPIASAMLVQDLIQLGYQAIFI